MESAYIFMRYNAIIPSNRRCVLRENLVREPEEELF